MVAETVGRQSRAPHRIHQVAFPQDQRHHDQQSRNRSSDTPVDEIAGFLEKHHARAAKERSALSGPPACGRPSPAALLGRNWPTQVLGSAAAVLQGSEDVERSGIRAILLPIFSVDLILVDREFLDTSLLAPA
jgi:hypothetical protein